MKASLITLMGFLLPYKYDGILNFPMDCNVFFQKAFDQKPLSFFFQVRIQSLLNVESVSLCSASKTPTV